jgi:hypothetical protein
MRILTPYEIRCTSGGSEPGESNYDNFWNSFFIASGAGAGYIASPFVAVGMMAYCIGYYAIYTPVYYTAYAIGSVFSGAFNAATRTVNVAMGGT